MYGLVFVRGRMGSQRAEGGKKPGGIMSKGYKLSDVASFCIRESAFCALIILVAGATASAQHFPPLDRDNPPKSRTVLRDQYCMTARKGIPSNSAVPLFAYDFAVPGASGTVLIDGKAVKTFKDQQHLRIYSAVSAGNHQFKLILDKPASLTFMVSNDDFKYCQP
jgi:hypothetical protein